MNLRDKTLRLALDAEVEGAMDLHYALLYLAGTMDEHGRNIEMGRSTRLVQDEDTGEWGSVVVQDHPWPGRGPECGIGLRLALRFREAYRSALVSEFAG